MIEAQESKKNRDQICVTAMLVVVEGEVLGCEMPLQPTNSDRDHTSN
jgi:hypothetical protein